MNEQITITAEEWLRGYQINNHYVEVVPGDEETVVEWQYARLEVLADGVPSLPGRPGVAGLGPLKAAAFALAVQRNANRDELVYDESGFRLFVRGWLSRRGIETTDEPQECDA